MLLLIIISVFFTAYLSVGAGYSRKRYAMLMAPAHRNAETRKNYERLKQLERQLSELPMGRGGDPVHVPGCMAFTWSAPENRISHCNCGAVNKLRVMNQEAFELRTMDSGIQEPDVIKPMFAWPVYSVTSYLKGGKYEYSRYDPELTAQLESQVLELE